jgi:peptidoglycan/LPS O-acetylase OafA/YrhL
MHKLRNSLGHALIVLGTLLGALAVGGYSLLRTEGYVAALIVLIANVQLLCGILLLMLPEDYEARITWMALSQSALGFLGLLLYSALQLADASSTAAALQLLACFMCGLSAFVVLRDMMYGDW